MKLIKNAFIYRIDLPSADALENHLAEIRHRDILPSEFSNAGFVPAQENDLVANYDGGIAFAVRHDEKILPSSVVNEETKRRVKEIEDANDCRVSKVERQAIKEQVTVDLLKVSHVRTRTITSFYHPASRFLIVPVSSRQQAAVVTSLLVRAVGAAKTTTINVSDVKGGLTTRLNEYLASFGDTDAFGKFSLSPEVWLKGEGGKVSYQIESIEAADKGLIEALNGGMKVEAVRLGYGPASFKLTSDFTFKSVRFAEPEDNMEHEVMLAHWKHEAAIQVLGMVQAIEALCELFDYKEPVSDGEK